MFTRLFNVEAWITQYFGQTPDSEGRYSNGYHNGLDVVPIDRQTWYVYAPMGGEIVDAGIATHYGNFLTIYDSRTGSRMRFAHLDSMAVGLGDKVSKEQLIAMAGNTGNSTARHLHIDLQFMRTYPFNDFSGCEYDGWVDPLPALRMMGVHI